MTTPVLSATVESLRAGGQTEPDHRLPATVETCSWGSIDRDRPPVLTVQPGDTIEVETLTHHAGDAPDLLMDEGTTAVWKGIPEADRGPGVHILTGPIAVDGARPGDAIVVHIEATKPRLPYGSNCAANWGLLYDRMGKERITIYELSDASEGRFGSIASPLFAFDFTTRELYDRPGCVTEPDPSARQSFSRPVRVPVRPHFGVIGVAPQTPGVLSSVPPGVFGGNVDNWRFGAGATICYPCFADGGNVYLGDPHFAQGDGEICGTAIEAPLTGRIRLGVARDLKVTSPVLETGYEWATHGFGDTLDEAMRMAAEQMLDLLTSRGGLTVDDAYSLCSVAVDFGVTQVVDGVVGCHALLTKTILA